MLQERDIILGDIEIAFKNFHHEREAIEILDERPIRVVKDLPILSEADARNFFEFLPPRKLGNRIVELFPCYEVDGQ